MLFHSVLYTAAKKGPTSSSVNALGSKASHGCVRLRVDDAKWIAQNCPAGTKCRVYDSGKTDSELRKLLKKKSFSRDKESYDYFRGRTSENNPQPDAPPVINLSRGKKGPQVTQLQTRLQGLGFFAAKVDGLSML